MAANNFPYIKEQLSAPSEAMISAATNLARPVGILRAEAVAASPATRLNIAGKPVAAVRTLAKRFANRFGKEPVFTGSEEPTAWLNDTPHSHQLFGEPATSPDEMIDSVAAWVLAGGETYGKPTKFEVRDGKF